MKTKLFAAILFVPLLFSCNSKADREALKEEVKAELQAEQTQKENEMLKDQLAEAQTKAAAAQASASQAKAEAKAAKQKAAQTKTVTRVNPAPTGLTHVKISNLNGLTNLRSSPNGPVCMRLKAYVDYDIYVDGVYNGWYNIVEIYRPDGSRVNLHSSNTGWWIARSICYVD